MTRRSHLLLALFAVLGCVVLVLALQDGPEVVSERARGSEALSEAQPVGPGAANTTPEAQLAAPRLPGSAATTRTAGGGTHGEAVLRGRLLDEHGEPVARATVVVTQHAPNATGEQPVHTFDLSSRGGISLDDLAAQAAPPKPVRTETRTDAEGRFEVPNLEPHALAVRATEQPRSPEATQVPGVVNARRSVSMSRDNPDAEIELRLPRGESLTGLVVGPAGRPVSPFRVKALRRLVDETPLEALARSRPHPRDWGRLDVDAGDCEVHGRFESADGRFTFTGLSPGGWWVTVIHFSDADGSGDQAASARAGKRGSTAHASRLADVPHFGVLRFVLPIKGLLEGEVRNAMGEPAPFALLELTSLDNDAPDKYAKTDADGRFEIPDLLRGQRYRIIAKHREHATSVLTDFEMGLTGASHRIDLRLRSFARVSGRVHAAHAQWAGRFVQLRGPESARTTADADGRFGFESVNPGEYLLDLAAARNDGDGDAATEVLQLAEGEHAQIVLGEAPARGIRVFGVVRSGGAVREGLDVTLAGGSRTVRGTTDAVGRYEVEVEVPGAYVLRLTDGAQSHRVPLEVPDAIEVRHDVDLAKGSISGRVTNREDAPLASVALALTGGTSAVTTTAADGSYTFGFLRPGDYTVRLLGVDEPSTSPEGLAATLAPHEARGGLDFQLERPARIEGHVQLRGESRTRVTSSTATSATVRLRFADGRAIATTRSDGKGTFTFEAVPHGALVVEASIEDATAEAPITCSPGETTSVRLWLKKQKD